MSNLILLTIGLALLIVGGELLVRGASALAIRLGMSPLLIGITLVGFGTSTPELVTSVQASLSGSPGIAIGNIVGSNIANILLILGIAAIISPIAVRQEALRRDGMFVLATALLFCVIGWFHALDRAMGSIFLIMLIAYLVYAYRQETAGAPVGHTAAYEKLEAHQELLDGSAGSADHSATNIMAEWKLSNRAIPLAMAIGGLIVLVLGGKLLVDGAIGVARGFGISETVIGLTIVAVGTSLPELVTSVIAAIRGHNEVALGNVLGSNIYNILGIGGAVAIIAAPTIPTEIVRFDNIVMLGASVLLLVVSQINLRIGRGWAALLLAGYGSYLFAIWPAS